MEKYDLTVIGSGPGGYIAAIRAAQLGMKTAVIERDKPGGVCLNWGCIPSKALLKCAEVYQNFLHSEDYGITSKGLSFDYSKVIQKSRNASQVLTKGVEFLFKKNKIDLYNGIGKLVANNKVGVKGKRDDIELSTNNILICTGSVPRIIPGIDVDGKMVMTSDEAIKSTDFPKSVVIIGGGYIGAEFAYVYNSFGSKVTIVEMEENLIPGADKEVAKTLEKVFKKSGMDVFTNTKYKSYKKTKTQVEVTVENVKDSKETTIKASQMLIAIGRKAVANDAPSSYAFYKESKDIGLSVLGIDLDEYGFIKTNNDYETTCSNVYAIGDVIGPPLLAHKASEEGVVAVEKMNGIDSRVHYNTIPSCVYCQPEIGSVGYTEEQAQELGIKYNVGKFPFKAAGKAVAVGETEGFVKIITDSNTGEVLGSHIIGHGATEMIAELTVAKSLESTAIEIAETSHAHPTLSEAIMEAALGTMGRARNI
ncbi:MAG: dihydrolipoyl dehydrogenase [Candidatus Dadabacteria bacterium]|nr:dihydrolipoyl dehydrogenase [Candidatus Dadabacteria bacterium]